MDLTKVIEIYGLQNLPGGEHCINEYEINADAIQKIQDACGIFDDNRRLEYVKSWADRIASDCEAKEAFCILATLISKRIGGERIKVKKKIDNKRFEMAAYLALLIFLPDAAERMKSFGIDDEMIKASILTPFAISLREDGDGYFFDVLKLFSWSQLYIDTKLLRIGVLNFELRDKVKDDCGGRLDPDDPVINVHIPRKTSLTPENCELAYKECARIVKRIFPDFKYKAFVCFSWMMDAQLKDMLKPESNIVKFQSRFELFSRNIPTDGIFNFIFGYPAGITPDYNELAEDTSLRRALKEHLLAGGQIYADGGIFYE